ncbi:hypothetical protein [Umezawaea sp.]|uniref:hypothetical protein n=1 Tax=Umezawaea sp. TaxID=1955258 RepID=UPI002ED10DFE
MSVERLRRHPGHRGLRLSGRVGRVSTAVSGVGLLFGGLTAAERDQLAELLPEACAHHEAPR